MKVHTEYLTFETKKRLAFVHITPQVEAAVKKSGVQEGLAFVSPMHITASVYVNDNESGLIQDIEEWLEKLSLLIKDPALRIRLGAAGQQTIEESYSLEVHAPRLLAVLQAAAGT